MNVFDRLDAQVASLFDHLNERAYLAQPGFLDAARERVRQTQKWGVQYHPDGTGFIRDKILAEVAKKQTDQHTTEGRLTWKDILLEEVAEAFGEHDRTPLRAELVQVAAVALCWIEDLDQRT